MASDVQWSATFASASTDAMSFYDDIMVPRMFEPWARLLLDEVGVEYDQAVLDVACGPGTVTRIAAERVGARGKVTGCDLSPAMLELARAKEPVLAGAPIDYLECSAEALGVADHTIDVVTCQQGLQFFPDRGKALAEMRRALRPGGKLGISVWCTAEDNPPFLALANALEEVLGAEVANTYKEGPWGFGDAAALVRLADVAGFTDVDVRRFELPIVFEGGPGQLMLTLRASAVATILAELSESAVAAFSSAVREATRHITVNGQVRSHVSSHVLTANVNGGT